MIKKKNVLIKGKICWGKDGRTVESDFTWFGHVRWKPIETLVKCGGSNGERPRKTLSESIKRTLDLKWSL